MGRPKKIGTTVHPKLTNESPELQEHGLSQHALNVQISQYDWYRCKELGRIMGLTVSDIVRAALSQSLESADEEYNGEVSLAAVQDLRLEVEHESRREQLVAGEILTTELPKES